MTTIRKTDDRLCDETMVELSRLVSLHPRSGRYYEARELLLGRLIANALTVLFGAEACEKIHDESDLLGDEEVAMRMMKAIIARR